MPLKFQLNRVALRLLLMLAAILPAACARPVKVDSLWKEGVARNQAFHHVFVVGVAPDYDVRCRFENMMAQSLRAANAEVTTSCSLMKSTDPLSRDSLVPLVVSSGADAVLSTKLLNHKVGARTGGTEDTRGKGYYKATGYGYEYGYGYYGAYGAPVTYVDFVAEESLVTLRRTVSLVSSVYETKGASELYSIETTAFDKKSVGEVMDVITTAVARRLQKDGLIR